MLNVQKLIKQRLLKSAMISRTNARIIPAKSKKSSDK